MREQNQTFLVRIGSRFFQGWDARRRPLAIAAPSLALHMSYRDADQLCQFLKARRYDVGVTDVYGRYATLGIIQELFQ